MGRIILKGAAVSPGIAIGTVSIASGSRFYDRRQIDEAGIAGELEAMDKASARVQKDIEAALNGLEPEMIEERELLAAQLELARDPKIIDGTKARIRHRKICAAWALSDTISELSSLFKSMADSYLAERATDINAIGKRLEDALGGITLKNASLDDRILAASWLSPADMVDFGEARVKGVLTEEGGATSHSAILAKSLKIPAVSGIGSLFEKIRSGAPAIVDGFRGLAILEPDESDLAYYRQSISNHDAFEAGAALAASMPAETTDGKIIPVLANLDHVSQTEELQSAGAEGIGLYRTEYSFLSGHAPNEEELANEYKTILASAGSGRVVFRTLDTGADKLLTAQEALHEQNPALGLRGIRFCLKNPRLFRMQLRAILRASSQHESAIMLPMITNLDEVLETRKILEELDSELTNEKLEHSWPVPLGVMVETPAAVLICDSLAGQCDFLSIGTNDLLHYIMAIDRGNRHVAYLQDPFHPAFIRALKQIIDSAHARGLKISVCGELAANPLGIPILVGLGVDALSASPRFIPTIKHIIRKLNAGECRRVAGESIARGSSSQTRQTIAAMLEKTLDASAPLHLRHY